MELADGLELLGHVGLGLLDHRLDDGLVGGADLGLLLLGDLELDLQALAEHEPQDEGRGLLAGDRTQGLSGELLPLDQQAVAGVVVHHLGADGLLTVGRQDPVDHDVDLVRGVLGLRQDPLEGLEGGLGLLRVDVLHGGSLQLVWVWN